jgi:hypothetical protein
MKIIREEKPPIGLIPRKAHDEIRSLSILEACQRYVSAGKKVPGEWVSELQDLIT